MRDVTVWQSWGVQPDVVMGHSIGEYVAACVAGVFSLEDALKLVANRGHLMQTCEEGRMLAVSVSEARAREIIAPFGDAVSVATINAPESVVLSGEPAAVESILASLADKEGIETKLLPIPRASHSPLMEPILAEFGRVAASITYSKPAIALCSNVTGELVSEQITDPAYWVRHLRQPVRFAESIETLHGEGFAAFLEVGPKPALLGMAGQCLPEDAEGIFIPSLREGHEDWWQMLGSLGQWYVQGGSVDWAALDGASDNESPRRKVQLPTYPFQRQRYWIDKARLSRRAGHDRTGHPLLGQKLQLSRSDDVYFESEMGLLSLPWLTDHRVFDAAVFPATGYLEMALAASTDVLP
ncbi:MAG: Polyketide synthase dehydratase, partial [Candidatus Kentron sp. G]